MLALPLNAKGDKAPYQMAVRLPVATCGGTCSLRGSSPDELVTTEYIRGKDRTEIAAHGEVLAVVDATNRERNLYLVSELLEVGIPMVLALNRSDGARDEGTDIKTEISSRVLGVPVVRTSPLLRQRISSLEREV